MNTNASKCGVSVCGQPFRRRHIQIWEPVVRINGFIRRARLDMRGFFCVESDLWLPGHLAIPDDSRPS
jgi:hypothetical protein